MSVIVAVVPALGALATPAAADGVGSLFGRVVDAATGDPITTACVSALGASTGWTTEHAVDSDGRYTIDALAPDEYQIHISDCATPPVYESKWYDDEQKWFATAFPVNDDARDLGDIALHVGGSISGTVTSKASGLPLADICVAATGISAADTGSATTGVDGSYTITALGTDSYRVLFQQCGGAVDYADQSYDGHPVGTGSNAVSVTMPAATGGADVQLCAVGSPDCDVAPGTTGSFHGRVTDSGGLPLADVCVALAGPPFTGLEVTHTDGAGFYTLSSFLFTASSGYDLYFYSQNCQPFGSPLYIQEVQHDITLEAGDDLLHNQVMRLTGTASGTVTDGVGAPLVGLDVAYQGQSLSASAPTDINGVYTTEAMHPGDARFRFTGNGADITKLVTIVESSVTTVDATLEGPGAISGVVTNANQEPLAGMCVYAMVSGLSATTDVDGAYTIASVPPGTQSVQFTDCVSYWYLQQVTSNVVVTSDATTIVDATMSTPDAIPGPGAISGVVTDSEGAPVEGICVETLDSLSEALDSLSTAVETGADGTYTISSVLPGAYDVRFHDCRSTPTLLDQYWSAASTRSAATQVTVAADTTTPDIDATMALGATISGVVTDQVSGAPLEVGVGAFTLVDGTYQQAATAITAADGSYTMGGLGAATYYFFFLDPDSPQIGGSGGNALEWWNNRALDVNGGHPDPVADGAQGVTFTWDGSAWVTDPAGACGDALVVSAELAVPQPDGTPMPQPAAGTCDVDVPPVDGGGDPPADADPPSADPGADVPGGTSDDSVAASGVLPFTGASIELLAMAGFGFLLMGGALVFSRPRRRVRCSDPQR